MTRSFKFGGAIHDREHLVWVNRPEEQALLDELFSSAPHPAYSLRAHRQMGKSTLLSRLADEARQRHWQVAHVDLRDQLFERSKDPGRFVESVAKEFFRTTTGLPAYRKAASTFESAGVDSALQRLCGYTDALAGTGRDTLFLIDEFEAVSGRGAFVQVLFEATLHMAFRRPNQKVVWLYAGTHSATDLIDPEGSDRSKYSAFRHWGLSDFAFDDESVVDQLVTGLAFETPEPRAVCREVLKWTGGQPLMTCSILGAYDATITNGKQATITAFQASPEILSNEHFRYPEEVLSRLPDQSIKALNSYLQIYQGKPIRAIRELNQHDDQATTRRCLLGSGLVRETGADGLAMRSPLYRRVFDEAWIGRMSEKLYNLRLESATVEPTRARRGAAPLPRIGMVNAGGTMGMDFDLENGKVVPPRGRDFWYLRGMQAGLPAIIDDLNPGFPPTDGVKISPAEWEKLADRLVAARNEDRARATGDRRRGVIIMTGTDSLAYVASALAFAMGRNLDWPIVLTGAQAPNGVPHGDSEVNLQRAIAVVTELHHSLREVTVAFGDEVFRGVRVEKINDFRYAGFGTPSYPPLAALTEKPRMNTTAGHFSDVISDLRTFQGLFPSDHIKHFERLIEDPVRTFDTDVLRISLYPGLKERMLKTIVAECHPSGLVLECLGLGNIPNDGEFNVLSTVQECKSKGIPVLITGRFPVDPEFVGQYDAASGPLRVGAISSGNMTPAAALTKFMWGLSAARRALGAQPDFEELTLWLRHLFAVSWVGEHDRARPT